MIHLSFDDHKIDFHSYFIIDSVIWLAGVVAHDPETFATTFKGSTLLDRGSPDNVNAELLQSMLGIDEDDEPVGNPNDENEDEDEDEEGNNQGHEDPWDDLEDEIFPGVI